MKARFRSKIDSWLLILLIIAMVGQIFALIAVVRAEASGIAKPIVVATTVLGVLLIASVLLRTHYTISDGNLRVVCGPFVWTISISEITGITKSGSALSSPALSLDRLRISYSHNRYILVSPADKKGFLKVIEENAT